APSAAHELVEVFRLARARPSAFFGQPAGELPVEVAARTLVAAYAGLVTAVADRTDADRFALLRPFRVTGHRAGDFRDRHAHAAGVAAPAERPGLEERRREPGQLRLTEPGLEERDAVREPAIVTGGLPGPPQPFGPAVQWAGRGRRWRSPALDAHRRRRCERGLGVDAFERTGEGECPLGRNLAQERAARAVEDAAAGRLDVLPHEVLATDEQLA